jgi:hypothetical protein
MKRHLGAVLVAAWTVACGQSQGAAFTASSVAGSAATPLGGNTGSAGEASGNGGSANGGTVGGSGENGGASGSGASSTAAGSAGASSGGRSGAGGASSAGSGGTSGRTSGGASAGGGAGTGGAGAAGSGGASGGGSGGSAGASGTGGASAGGTGGGAGAGGGSAGTGGSGAVETAFLMNTLELVDPHAFLSVIGCDDLTDPPGLDGTSVNGELSDSLTLDRDADGLLDLAPVLLFEPLNQTDASTTNSKLIFAGCTAPEASSRCSPHGATAVSSIATTMSTGTCLTSLAGTTSGYSPGVTPSTGPCFSSGAPAITLPLLGVPVPLTDVHWAAQYVGAPATGLKSGLIFGFLSQANADATLLPATLPLAGGQPLSSLLPGGTNACPTRSDKDTDNGVTGWWLYFNFTAKSVPWSAQP